MLAGTAPIFPDALFRASSVCFFYPKRARTRVTLTDTAVKTDSRSAADLAAVPRLRRRPLDNRLF
ncbi:hypothetical protein BCAR13_800043 [Paraburkholderia caribensis]|nr:hypothetical protein BCAR13_800043 [Paraburkholderia caribensis]